MKRRILTAAVAVIATATTWAQNGKVGINTVNPQATFHVNGGTTNTDTDTTNDMVVTNTGKMGIGKLTPTAKLDIKTATGTPGFRLDDGTQQAGRVLTTDNNGLGTWQTLSLGNKTTRWYSSGPVTFSTPEVWVNVNGTSHSFVGANEIGLTATDSTVTIPAGKYLMFFEFDISGAEYQVVSIRRVTDNTEIYATCYGEWLTSGTRIVEFNVPTELRIVSYVKATNPSPSYYRTTPYSTSFFTYLTFLKLN